MLLSGLLAKWMANRCNQLWYFGARWFTMCTAENWWWCMQKHSKIVNTAQVSVCFLLVLFLHVATNYDILMLQVSQCVLQSTGGDICWNIPRLYRVIIKEGQNEWQIIATNYDILVQGFTMCTAENWWYMLKHSKIVSHSLVKICLAMCLSSMFSTQSRTGRALQWNLIHQNIIIGCKQGNCKQELKIQIEWRQIWYLWFTYQSQIVSEYVSAYITTSSLQYTLSNLAPKYHNWLQWSVIHFARRPG